MRDVGGVKYQLLDTGTLKKRKSALCLQLSFLFSNYGLTALAKVSQLYT